jgi:replicative DNA helicase
MTQQTLTPPSSPELEKQLLSCLLIDGAETLSMCFDGKITDQCFYDRRNSLLYKTMVWLHRNNKPMTSEAIYEELGRTKKMDDIGGLGYLTEVMGACHTTSNRDYAIEELRKLYVMRELQKKAIETSIACSQYSGNLEQFLAMQNQLISLYNNTDATVTLADAAVEFEAMLSRIDDGTENMDANAVSWGDSRLDDRLGKLRPGELVGVGARPSVGKSSLARWLSLNAVTLGGINAYYASLEVNSDEMVRNWAVGISKLPWKQYITATAKQKADFHAAVKQIATMKNMHLYTKDRTVSAICARCRSLKAAGRLDIILVDHLHHMSFADITADNDEGRIRQVCKSLKDLATDLRVPCVMLFQLNRSSDREGNREPRLADARGSGAIEEVCNKIMLLHRPNEDDTGMLQDANDGSTTLYHTMTMAKGRDDGRCRIGYRFHGPTTTFNWLLT